MIKKIFIVSFVILCLITHFGCKTSDDTEETIHVTLIIKNASTLTIKAWIVKSSVALASQFIDPGEQKEWKDQWVYKDSYQHIQYTLNAELKDFPGSNSVKTIHLGKDETTYTWEVTIHPPSTQ